MSATPGPWRVEQDTTLIWGACDADENSSRGMGYPIAVCRVTPAGQWTLGPDSDEGEANAKFIAAAPDLADALFNLLTVLGQHEQPADVIAACEAASAALIKSGRVMG